MAAHRLYLDTLGPAPGSLTITGEEAHHAVRVKRLRPGEAVQVLDGRGRVVDGEVVEARSGGSGKRAAERTELVLRITADRIVPPLRPAVHLLTAPPKGDRLGEMIDGLSQVGAASWAPLLTARTVVEPREAKLDRLHRVAVEAAKQCGRAWVLDLSGGPRAFEDAIHIPGAVLADVSGIPYKATGAAAITVLIGPEGGWTAGELEAARGVGVRVVRVGPHVMRVETAAVVAAAIVLEAERGSPGE